MNPVLNSAHFYKWFVFWTKRTPSGGFGLVTNDPDMGISDVVSFLRYIIFCRPTFVSTLSLVSFCVFDLDLEKCRDMRKYIKQVTSKVATQQYYLTRELKSLLWVGRQWSPKDLRYLKLRLRVRCEIQHTERFLGVFLRTLSSSRATTPPPPFGLQK